MDNQRYVYAYVRTRDGTIYEIINHENTGFETIYHGIVVGEEYNGYYHTIRQNNIEKWTQNLDELLTHLNKAKMRAEL